MRKIALIRFYKNYSNEPYANDEKIVSSITEWTDVNEEDFKRLINFSDQYNYTVVELLNPYGYKVHYFHECSVSELLKHLKEKEKK